VGPAVQTRSLAEQLSRAFTFFGVLVAGAFALTALAYALSWSWITPELERSRHAGKAESAAFSAMVDEENGLRAYLLTRDTHFLDPYVEVAAGLLRTRIAEERWHERWAQAVAETPPESIAPAPPMLRGKELFDDYRSERAALAAAIEHRTQVLYGRDQWATQVRVVLDLAVFMCVLVAAVRQYQAVRDAIVIPVEALLRHIVRVRDGQLEATVDPAGPRDLRELGQGLNDMVRALATAREMAESRDDLVRKHSTRLRQILDASREFSESLNLAYVVGAVRTSTAAVGGYDRVIVWLMDVDQKRLLKSEKNEDTEQGNATPRPEVAVEMGQGLAGRAAKSGRITFECPEGQVRFSDSNKGPVCAIAIPLIVGARVVGALEARHDEPMVATIQAVEILEMFATHAATAIEAARLHELTEERSQTDALTRLFNRRRLDEDLDAECKRCVRYARPLAFVMLDVDYFKAFNDSHGHPQADVALQEVAKVIASAVRTTDTAYRYGGEEFGILLRETSGADGMIFAERLRYRIEQRFATGTLAGLTASFGVAEFSANTPTPRELVVAADAAMYASKHAGRNRVMLSSTPPPLSGVLPNGEVEPQLSS
jgi:diguanylate cyclase (GGDEF)-like protein